MIRSVFALIMALFGVATASAQPTAPEKPAILEVAMEVRNGDVTCRPPRAAVTADSLLHLQVVNRSERPLSFVAPKFFSAAEHLQSAGFTLDLVQGGFSVAPDASVTVALRTPRPGEYYFSCFQPGGIPNPRSSGFIEVVDH